MGLLVGGSSPLTRGKRVRCPCRAGAARLIPAHAGKTRISRPGPPVTRAHPRSRGENEVPATTGLTIGGSSPLTRGKRCDQVVDRGGGRLIPAHAGKTPRPRPIARRAQAHPRSRGENLTQSRHFSHWRGSSPLTRGKRIHSAPQRHQERLIPAHAGKTRRQNPGARKSQ